RVPLSAIGASGTTRAHDGRCTTFLYKLRICCFSPASSQLHFHFMFGLRRLTLWGFFVLMVDAASVRAESEAFRLPETLSASPDAPAFGYIWRKESRIVLSLAIPILGGSPDARWGLHLTPFVELHNRSGSYSVVSNEEWRGRASLELWRSWVRGSDPNIAPWLRLGLGLKHESDHATVRREVPVPPYSFRQLN